MYTNKRVLNMISKLIPTAITTRAYWFLSALSLEGDHQPQWHPTDRPFLIVAPKGVNASQKSIGKFAAMLAEKISRTIPGIAPGVARHGAPPASIRGMDRLSSTELSEDVSAISRAVKAEWWIE